MYPNSFEKVEVFNITNCSCNTKYMFNGRKISSKKYQELVHRFERIGFSSIKGVYQSEYKVEGNKHTHIDRYILYDIISCNEELQEVLKW